MKIKVKKPVYVSCYTICRSRTKGLWLKCGCFQCPEYPVNIITKYLWKYILSLGLSFYFWITSLNWLQWHYGCLPLRGKPIGPRANGTQNSELVNFVPESRLPIVQISSIYRKNGREGLKLVSKMALKKWNTNFRSDIPPEKTGLPFQMFRCSWKFSAGTTQKVVFHILSKRIFRTSLVNGRQPTSPDGRLS